MSEPIKSVYKKSITIENVNQNILQMEYAVRGPVFTRLTEIEKQLDKGVELPFKKVIKAYIGDCQALGQTPITFITQVLACLSCPGLLSSDFFPEDVKTRAAEILRSFGGTIGSYTSSLGSDMIRQSVAEYMKKRDGHTADWHVICLTPGASTGVKNCLQLLDNNVNGKTSGVMIPIPQYPLYSASIVEFGLHQVEYYLDESKNWGLTIEELERAYASGSENSNIRALVVINPGNPTGQVLTRENIEAVIKFAFKYSLMIIADEVYQQNIYEGRFVSFKKVLKEIGFPYNQVELVSLMSVSKGFMGECGLRGGWMEIVNVDADVQASLYKGISARYCPNTLGQAAVDYVARPPRIGEPSYTLYVKESSAVLNSLKKKARVVELMFSAMEGFSCNALQGAMYAFPRLELPPRAISAAAAAGVTPDEFYCLKLLDETGVCVVPGSGFGQQPGTHHFRTTILPPMEAIMDIVTLVQKFHENFIREYNV